jgi:hypothetical protein
LLKIPLIINFNCIKSIIALKEFKIDSPTYNSYNAIKSYPTNIHYLILAGSNHFNKVSIAKFLSKIKFNTINF